jgi:6-phosphogluconolactonase (cycloisomerase 2 family)
MSYKILVAAYSTQIVTLSFDPTSSPPKLAIHSSTKSDKNPSWIAPHPTDKSLVFAGIELEDAKIQVYRIVGDGKLEFVEEISTGGAGVAHLAVSEHEIIAGNVSLFNHLSLLLDSKSI